MNFKKVKCECCAMRAMHNTQPIIS